MKKHLPSLIFLWLICFSQLLHAQETGYAPDRLVISLNNSTPVNQEMLNRQRFGIAALDLLNEKYHCSNIHVLKRQAGETGGVYVLTFTTPIDAVAVAEEYSGTGAVRYAEPDYTGTLGDNKTTGTAPNDTWFSRQWSLNNDGSFPLAPATAKADIDMLRAWDIEEGDTSVVVAIIDAGCKMDHPEFAGRLWRNYQEIPGDLVDNDNNGYVDDTLGWNTVTGTNDPTDDHGHGTNVTGIMGANANNADGYSGVDHHCKLMICKAADATGFFAYTWLTEAVYYAVDNGANIINISAGGATFSNILQDAIDYADAHGVLVVAAMMNAGNMVKNYPAACTHVMAVGATGPTDKRAYFSNYGSHISVVAPGEYIYGLNHLSDTAYSGWMSGTSQATPHVAGLAALLLAQDHNRTPQQIRELIETNAEDMVGDGQDSLGFERYYGHGRINAYRALTNAAVKVSNKLAVTESWSIYPNPAKDVIYVRSSHLTAHATATIRNLNGQILKEQEIKADHAAIHIRDLATGLYFVTIRNSAGSYTVKISKN